MRIKWPEPLIEDLAERRCIIFIGSGASATSLTSDGNRPKTWEEFIAKAKMLVSDLSCIGFIDDLLGEKNYLLALQCIFDNCNKAAYYRLLQSEYSDPHFLPSQLHKDIVAIDPKISITTNFDKIYDRACSDEGHSVIPYYDSDNLADIIRSNKRVIIKAHGTIDNTHNLVFTKREYLKAKKMYPEFYQILSALFITNTLLFLGCGMNDPDVNLILEDVYTTTKAHNPHYVVTSNQIHPYKEKYWLETYNVVTLKYGPDHDDLIENVSILKDEILSYRHSRGLI